MVYVSTRVAMYGPWPAQACAKGYARPPLPHKMLCARLCTGWVAISKVMRGVMRGPESRVQSYARQPRLCKMLCACYAQSYVRLPKLCAELGTTQRKAPCRVMHGHEDLAHNFVSPRSLICVTSGHTWKTCALVGTMNVLQWAAIWAYRWPRITRA